MFVYLSKLLPLFVYPLGLALLLLVISAATRRRTALSLGISLAAISVLIVFSNGLVAGQMARSLEWRYLPPQDMPSADAIVLLGGATRAAVYPRAMTEMNEAGDRLLHAARLYLEGKAPVIIVSGGAIDWLGSATPEANGMQEILEFMDVPSGSIILEPGSRNTYENALHVRDIANEQGIERILLVTSALHMPRSVGIFEKQGFQVMPAPTDFLATRGDAGTASTSLGARLYHLVPDAEYLLLSSRAMKEYIGIAVYRMRGWM